VNCLPRRTDQKIAPYIADWAKKKAPVIMRPSFKDILCAYFFFFTITAIAITTTTTTATIKIFSIVCFPAFF